MRGKREARRVEQEKGKDKGGVYLRLDGLGLGLDLCFRWRVGLERGDENDDDKHIGWT